MPTLEQVLNRMCKCSYCHTHYDICDCEALAEEEKGHFFNDECECDECKSVSVDCCWSHKQRWFELKIEREQLDAWLEANRFRKVGSESYCFIPIMYYDKKKQRMIYRRAHSVLPMIEIKDEYFYY